MQKKDCDILVYFCKLNIVLHDILIWFQRPLYKSNLKYNFVNIRLSYHQL